MNNLETLEATEKAVLAVLLTDSRSVIPVLDVLPDGGRFFNPLHGRVYDAILACTKANVIPNAYTVADRLGESANLEQVKALAALFNPQVHAQVTVLAQVVEFNARRRQLQEATKEAHELSFRETEDLEGAAFFAAQMILSAVEGFTTERNPHIAEISRRVDAHIATLAQSTDRLLGYPTGLEWLNDKTGGFQPGHFWLVSAPYKMRKTTLMHNMIVGACRAGASVSVFAAEGDQETTVLDLRALVATEYLRSWGMADKCVLSDTFLMYRTRDTDQQAAVNMAKEEIDTWKLRIYDAKDGIASAQRIANKVKRDRFMFGLNIACVDYLQLLGKGRLFERLEETTHVLQTLLSQEAVTGILLAQLSEAAIWDMKGEGDNYSPGVKGGGDPAAAADFALRTLYEPPADGQLEGRLTLDMKLSRKCAPGKRKYGINAPSGYIYELPQ